MSLIEDRGKNKMDGTYVNVPDHHFLEPSKNIGLREYNNGVLIHNWYEDRNPVRSGGLIINLDFKTIFNFFFKV